MKPQRLASVVLFAGGVIFVFVGLTTALGDSITGIIASMAAIAALLYAGGVWLGAAPPRTEPGVVLFTSDLRIASGRFAGRSLLDALPAIDRHDLESRCREALAGYPSRVSPARGGSPAFAASAVRDAEGTVRYGLLLVGALAEGKGEERKGEEGKATEVNEVSLT